MSNRTKIEWTDSSWNPVTGCTKISSGCENCYAATFAKRLKAMHNPRYRNGFEVTVHEDLLQTPLTWKSPRKIFVNSMSDLFHEELSDEIILRIFDTMNKADWHIFQVLTKRSKRLKELSCKINWTNNIWMGVTVENEESLYRAEDLKKTGAKIKFISAEPLLTALDSLNLEGIDWIIVGGESGHHSRPMEKEWVVNIRNNAHKTNVPFFFKQWGGKNKKKAGRLLDGRTYDEYPEVISID
jgi:protein gp37